MQFLFSYGTLQKSAVQQQLFGRKFTGCPDTLYGFKIVPVEISDPAFLATGEQALQRMAIPSPGTSDCIEGTVLELTEEELQKVDQYEPPGYTRIKVVLVSGKGAWLYTSAEMER